MKKLLFITTCFAAMPFGIWKPNFEMAKQTAAAKHQLILLNFSGDDWCVSFMSMYKEIFKDNQFTVIPVQLLYL
jgi:thiol:disulfide interchange protein